MRKFPMRASTLLILIFAAACPFPTTAQQPHTLTLHAKNADKTTLYLSEFRNVDFRVADSAQTDAAGIARFTMKPNYLSGVYRIIAGKDKYTDVVYNAEDIEMVVDYQQPDSFMVVKSLENKLFYDFLKYVREADMKLELLTSLIDYYPEDDPFYEVVTGKYNEIQVAVEQRLGEMGRSHPASMAYALSKLQVTPYIPVSVKGKDRLDYLRQHYLDKTDFNDARLLSTNAYADKVISYLSLYSDRRLTQKELEEEFIKGIDFLMARVEPYPETYSYVVKYLVNGFERYKFERVLNHISDNYLNKFSCENEQEASELQKRLDAYKKLAIGQPVPDFTIQDVQKKTLGLSDLKTEYSLLIFWATWCPHCTSVLPELKAIYTPELKKRMEVVAVSLDTSYAEWSKFVSEGDYKWRSVSELKGWQSKIADDYHIYATPTMFLINREHKIVAKPITMTELRIELQGLCIKW
jgi:peroxiredoxin